VWISRRLFPGKRAYHTALRIIFNAGKPAAQMIFLASGKIFQSVFVHVGNFTDVEPELPADYDYICLIGVFEYGQAYIGATSSTFSVFCMGRKSTIFSRRADK